MIANKSKARKIGILGGTFDPIHFGHLRMAIESRELLKLDEVRLIPCAVHAHHKKPFFSAENRLQMLKLACKKYDYLIADDCEIRMNEQSKQPSFTFNTLQFLKNHYPNAALFLILGEDSFANLNSWYKWQNLLDLCNLVIIKRPNINVYNDFITKLLDNNLTTIKQISSHLTNQIIMLDNLQIPISSTQIRDLLQQKRKIDFLTPAVVCDFIYSIDSSI